MAGANNYEISPTIDQTVSTPDYTNKSQGYIGDTSVGKLIEGAGNILEMAVKTTDNFFKNSITEETNQKVNAERDGAILEGEIQVKTLSDPNVPPELKSKQAELDRIQSAKNQGRMRDSYYWARMDNIAKELRSKYPGYREHIDNTVAGLLGTTPANALVKALNREVDSLKSTKQVDEVAAYVDKHTADGLISPQTAARVGTANPPTMSELRVEATTNGYLKARTAQSTAIMANRQAANTLTQTEQSTAFNGEVHATFATQLSGFRPILDKINQEATAEIAARGQLSPEFISKAQASIAQARLEFSQKMAGVSAKGVYSGMNPETAKASIASYDNIFNMAGESLKNGTLSTTSQAITAIMEDATKTALGSTVVQGDAALQKLLGPQGAMYYQLPGGDSRRLEAAKEIARKRALQDYVMSNKGTQQIVAEAKKEGLSDQTVSEILMKPLTLLADPATPKDVQKKLILNLFGEQGDPSVVLNLGKSNTDSRKIYEQWTSPAVYQALKRASNDDPTIMENYQKFTTFGGQRIYTRELGDIRETSSNGNMVTVDFINGQFVARPNPDFQGGRAYYSIPTATAQQWNEGRLVGMNNVIKNMTPVWKDQGLDPKAQALKMLNISMEGVDTAGEGSSLKAFRNLSQSVRPAGIMKAGLDGLTSSDKTPVNPMNEVIDNNNGRLWTRGEILTNLVKKQRDAQTGTLDELDELSAQIEKTDDPTKKADLMKDFNSLLKQMRQHGTYSESLDEMIRRQPVMDRVLQQETEEGIRSTPPGLAQ